MDFDHYLEILIENSVITAEDKNLRSKIESISSSIVNLQRKRARIDLEIRRQALSLRRKREELKRVTKRNQKTLSETVILNEQHHPLKRDILLKNDQRLLQKSSQSLEIYESL